MAIGLQRGVKQYLSTVHPVTCSFLWVRCLFDRFSISDFGGKWPLKWQFSKVSFRIPRRDTELRFVTKFGENRQLRSCQKVHWITTQKNSGSAGLVPVPILPQMGRSRPKFSKRCCLWHVHVYWIWSGSAAVCRTYSGKIDFSAPKVITTRNTFCRTQSLSNATFVFLITWRSSSSKSAAVYKISSKSDDFCHTMLCISAAYAVIRCLCVCHVRGSCQNE